MIDKQLKESVEKENEGLDLSWEEHEPKEVSRIFKPIIELYNKDDRWGKKIGYLVPVMYDNEKRRVDYRIEVSVKVYERKEDL